MTERERDYEKKDERASRVPVSIDEAGIDVVGALQPSDWLKAHSSSLIRHDVHQAVLELVTGQVGTYKPRRVGLGVGQSLHR